MECSGQWHLWSLELDPCMWINILYICVNWIKYTILYTRNMTRIISQIYIEQTNHPTTVKIYIIIYVIMYVVRFKIYEWVFSGLVENSSYWYQNVVGSNPTTVDIKFLSCARSPNLISPFGKMSTDVWWQGVLHIELALKILVYVVCTRVEADNRRARHKQCTRTHTTHISKNS